MFKIPRIMTSQEVLDKAYRRVDKIHLSSTDLKRRRELSHSKLDVLADTCNTTLARYVKSFPSFEALQPFYRELVKLTVDVDRLRQSLGQVDASRKVILRMAKDGHKRISAAGGTTDLERARKHAYGRISSVMEKLTPALSDLGKARLELKSLPEIDMGIPTIVVAGCPNVGKSLLVLNVSTANPKIAAYPFTTKSISIGYFEHHRIRYQIIDTPGILDRPLEKRNDIERRAILAVRYLADIILFVYDPTEECGYGMGAQENLSSELSQTFDEVPFMEVENKVDRIETTSKRMKISAHTRAGLDDMIEALVSRLNTGKKVIQK